MPRNLNVTEGIILAVIGTVVVDQKAGKEFRPPTANMRDSVLMRATGGDQESLSHDGKCTDQRFLSMSYSSPQHVQNRQESKLTDVSAALETSGFHFGPARHKL